jgi:hypothetical protein
MTPGKCGTPGCPHMQPATLGIGLCVHCQRKKEVQRGPWGRLQRQANDEGAWDNYWKALEERTASLKAEEAKKATSQNQGPVVPELPEEPSASH